MSVQYKVAIVTHKALQLKLQYITLFDEIVMVAIPLGILDI